MKPVALPWLLTGLVAASVLASCVDKDQAFVADNTTDQDLLARVTGKDSRRVASGVTLEWRQTVVVVAAHSRSAILNMPFSDTFPVWTVEILNPDCSVVAAFAQDADHSWDTDGRVFVIEPGPTVTQRPELPAGDTPAPASDRCHKLPDE